LAAEDRFAMEALANLLRQALERGILQPADLMTTEAEVIEKLRADAACGAEWERFCAFSRILRSRERPQTGQWLCVDAKRRWIDPLAWEKGRVSRWDEAFREELRAFREMDFSCWLSAE